MAINVMHFIESELLYNIVISGYTENMMNYIHKNRISNIYLNIENRSLQINCFTFRSI